MAGSSKFLELILENNPRCSGCVAAYIKLKQKKLKINRTIECSTCKSITAYTREAEYISEFKEKDLIISKDCIE